MKNKRKLNSGIYQIRNILNNDLYIGQSADFRSRKYNHYSGLKNNKSRHNILQNAINKYGIENFVFEILIYCEDFELTRYEQFFVNKYDPKYNVLKECVDSCKGVKRSEEIKEKMSKEQKKRYDNYNRNKAKKYWETINEYTHEKVSIEYFIEHFSMKLQIYFKEFYNNSLDK